jgi:hypothetical protein
MRSTRMRAADGQWWSCDQGIDRYTHQPYTYWRPIYPDAPKVAYGRTWAAEEETGYMPPPPPQQVAIPVDVEHPSIPKAVKTACAPSGPRATTSSRSARARPGAG